MEWIGSSKQGLRGHETFFEGKGPSDLKRDVFRINRVHFTVVKIHLKIHDPVARQDSFFGCLPDPLSQQKQQTLYRHSVRKEIP